MPRDGEVFAAQSTQRKLNVCHRLIEGEPHAVSEIILGGNRSILSHETVEVARAQLHRGCKAIYDVKRLE
jgi:hypothetical protein